MRQFIALFVSLVGAFAYSGNLQPEAEVTIEPYIFEDLINSTIESFRANLSDPLLLDAYEIDLPDNGTILGNASIANLELKGLKGFQVPYLNFALIGFRLNFTIDLPVLDLYTDFNLNLLIADTLAIWGNGNVTVHLDNIDIQGSAQANLTDGLSVDNVRIQLQLGNGTFEIHGLLDDEDLSSLLSSILNDLAVKLIDENQELITEIISPIIQDLINSILASADQTTTAPPADVTAALN
ncbi:uncharacterized protein BDFB_010032 [Asbolus verrucosus]|uniref:JHBP domain containing protein n=1 Tax=Asbolus verrucosus TaxID=1661398 RepID=A0A482W0K1_ASBVE|nr:uncharacterized protein BDFB_010032 [Asbolus verrucosus]